MPKFKSNDSTTVVDPNDRNNHITLKYDVHLSADGEFYVKFNEQQVDESKGEYLTEKPVLVLAGLGYLKRETFNPGYSEFTLTAQGLNAVPDKN